MNAVIIAILMALNLNQAYAAELNIVNPQITDSVTQKKLGNSDVPDNMLSLDRRLAANASITAVNNSRSDRVEFQIVQNDKVVASQKLGYAMAAYFPVDYSAAKRTVLRAYADGTCVGEVDIDERMRSVELTPAYQLYVR